MRNFPGAWLIMRSRGGTPLYVGIIFTSLTPGAWLRESRKVRFSLCGGFVMETPVRCKPLHKVHVVLVPSSKVGLDEILTRNLTR